GGNKAVQPPVPPAPPQQPQQPAAAAENTNTVEITSTGFTPDALTIKAGETVVFVNNDALEHWPASAVHPTHTVYPGSDISKCGSAAAATIFDACKRLDLGDSFNFVFNEKGSWKYHDHLNPSLRGTVVVE
ncbi:MAG: cupredoxin domain-containing protein, partial [Nanoarchaeota archaeon]